MSRSTLAALEERSPRMIVMGFIMRQCLALLGFALFLGLVAAVAALATWNVADPSLSYATSRSPTNVLGYPGAVFADLAMQFFGLASVAALLPVLAWSLSLISGRKVTRLPRRFAAWGTGAVAGAAVFGCFPPPATWPIPNGIGGVIGDMILRFPALFVGAYPTGGFAMVLGVIFAAPMLWLMLFAAGIIGNEDDDFEAEILAARAGSQGAARKGKAVPIVEEDEEDDRTGPLALIAGAVTHAWFTGQARLRRLAGVKPQRRERAGFDQPYDFNDDTVMPVQGIGHGDHRADPSFEPGERSPGRRRITPPSVALDDDSEAPFDLRTRGRSADDILFDDEDEDRAARPAARRVAAAPERPRPAAAPVASFAGPRGTRGFQLPSVQLLAEPRAVAKDTSLSADQLEHNARMLEGVLEDFGVKGDIIEVRPGPVVTLYELEPAPGIKSSRVIGLADDIARSMSAIAARVAVVPGRNAIGIELPNRSRETVYLREMIGSRDFDGSKAKLPMALGKTIGGEPVIADLAKMPHLLVAGTTGSGKSVAINTMILSLVYRLPPEKCRLIMIDPKMLELSIYDGIPHLLSPVVTDPKKAVVALKWTVREMEERYKKMSKIGVRNIDGFNSRVEQAIEKGEVLTRTVQTGFDRQTGEAMYETETFDLQPMPYIVVIIDEMADLMMVAGKDIEGAVQRLAQMARAAGIHVIMATQRPSVDVITGTIKANFPTRISFQVTSKIDSRTILGEQGAEQLLGMGDMLYMAGGGRIQRVHGPFVSDSEVEDIVAYLKTQGAPDYLDAVTIDEDGDEDGGGPAGTGNLSESDDPYDQAVAIVLRDGKASTSYVQRRLGIGYNRAASLIERMEQEGIIGPANHAGKREILVPTEADIVER
ncbi:DNA translocase FtsK [Allorhizobium taibaishanense]|uniref:DNA translocase FtsK n=1 Tax=Allorhizobium taibaishanense TaxID=887144 RepID=A0A1Q9A205_9HYPH|nr:DNA translocase FtsK [Allorhizobium taibaishanense]MBB4009123.1 S-DNA-T family DNA segregation ATPase FtsK/SpoIIIE [Allorhizobium taibaishanense]OLP48586.1 cell division protein FtsK [Allorhizobium taibaishanense]